MLEIIKSWPGKVQIDDELFNSLDDVHNQPKRSYGTVMLYSAVKQPEKTEPKQYVITVKSYMTKTATPTFRFMEEMNNNNPMPLVTMVGTEEKETRGMVYMKLHGEIIARTVPHCMKCGKPLTNSVSQFFGMGPECGQHNYVNPFLTEKELEDAVAKYRREYLHSLTWEGWVIKSAIISKTEFKEDNENA